jgi:hypothetical protein
MFDSMIRKQESFFFAVTDERVITENINAYLGSKQVYFVPGISFWVIRCSFLYAAG